MTGARQVPDSSRALVPRNGSQKFRTSEPSPGQEGCPQRLGSLSGCAGYNHIRRERPNSWGTDSICLKGGGTAVAALRCDASSGSTARSPIPQLSTSP